MQYNWYLRFTSAGFIKICVFSFVQMKFLDFSNWILVVSSMLGIIGCTVAICFPIVILFLVRSNKLTDKNYTSKYGGIF